MQHIANNLVIMGRLATRTSFESEIVDLERLMRARRAGSVEIDTASACSNRPGEQGREPTPLVGPFLIGRIDRAVPNRRYRQPCDRTSTAILCP
jgi:hypothetical protein